MEASEATFFSEEFSVVLNTAFTGALSQKVWICIDCTVKSYFFLHGNHRTIDSLHQRYQSDLCCCHAVVLAADMGDDSYEPWHKLLSVWLLVCICLSSYSSSGITVTYVDALVAGYITLLGGLFYVGRVSIGALVD